MRFGEIRDAIKSARFNDGHGMLDAVRLHVRYLMALDEIEQLTASRDTLERECERLRENNAHLHARRAEAEYTFTEAHNRWQELVELTGAGHHLSTTTSIHRAVCRWIKEAKESKELLPRVADAVKAAAIGIAEREDKSLSDAGEISRAMTATDILDYLREIDVSAIIASLTTQPTGADERERESK